MAKALVNWAKSLFGADVIVTSIEKQDPIEIARDAHKLLDTVLDNEFGNGKSAKIQKVIAPFFKKFSEEFMRCLLSDQS